MRQHGSAGGLSVKAIAGTHTVHLGFDLADAAGCLGFGLHRTDKTEGEAYWLRGLKTFPSLVPTPNPGMDYSLAEHPLQGFQWGDYSAKPEHEYTYRVVAFGGQPGALTNLAEVNVDVTTEAEDDNAHGIWFNRGVAGSQAFVKRFGHFTPPTDGDESHPSFEWLSRGLGEAFVAFVGRANDASWGLRGAFYEFTWKTGLAALATAATQADVSLVVHGRDKDPAGGDDNDKTAADNRGAVTAAGLDPYVIWRTAANKGALQHNKFLVLTHNGQPVAVWTGSTNITQGAVFGHLNVGHLINDPSIASQFLDYWEQLADNNQTTADLRTWTTANNPVDTTQVPTSGMTAIFSPRDTHSSLLDWYATTFDSHVQERGSAHITGAFGLHQVFRTKLAIDEEVVRTVLLDKEPTVKQAIPHNDPDVRVSWGDYLQHNAFDAWAGEHLTDFNKWVKFIHTKIILVDPLTDSPTIITGSANYSDNSTFDNEENSVVIRGDQSTDAKRIADIYLTEYQRIFMHFVFRDWANSTAAAAAASPGPARLVENDSWTDRYYEADSWRARQRTFFAGT